MLLQLIKQHVLTPNSSMEAWAGSLRITCRRSFSSITDVQAERSGRSEAQGAPQHSVEL